LLAQERPAEYRHRVERRPGARIGLLADRQALAEYGFGLGPLLLLEQVRAEGRQRAGIGGGPRPRPLLDRGQPLAPPRLGRAELPEPLVAVADAEDDRSRGHVPEA